MKARPNPYDPFANPHTHAAQPAANDAVTRTAAAPAPKGGDRSILEARYSGMVQAISLMWGYPELNAYFDRLWIADGTQTPIDPEAMSELMLLAQVHQALVPQRPARSLASIYGADRNVGRRKDLWDDVPSRR